jgi:hypothetical protein
MHFNLLLIHISHFIMWQDYETAFRNTTCSSLEQIRERLCMFIVSEVINPKGYFLQYRGLNDCYALRNIYLVSRMNTGGILCVIVTW